MLKRHHFLSTAYERPLPIFSLSLPLSFRLIRKRYQFTAGLTESFSVAGSPYGSLNPMLSAPQLSASNQAPLYQFSFRYMLRDGGFVIMMVFSFLLRMSQLWTMFQVVHSCTDQPPSGGLFIRCRLCHLIINM